LFILGGPDLSFYLKNSYGRSRNLGNKDFSYFGARILLPQRNSYIYRDGPGLGLLRSTNELAPERGCMELAA
jgi:hypothetical protein